MPVAALTKKAVAAFNCPIDKDRTILWDTKTPGFGLAAFQSGKKTFVAQFREKGRSRRVTIGDGTMPLAEARVAAKKALSAARQKSQHDRRVERERTRLERPVLGFDKLISVRLPEELIRAIDAWAAEHAYAAPDGLSRSSAIRMLLADMLMLRKGGVLPGELHARVVITDGRDVEKRQPLDPKQAAKRLADKYIARNGKPR